MNAIDTTDLRTAVAEITAAAEFLKGPYFQTEVIRAAQRAAVHAMADLVDRQTAADLFFCSPSEIDRAAAAGVFKRHMRAGTPLFEKREIRDAIMSGKWPRRGGKA